MAESFNININNGMASGKSTAMRKISAKGSVSRNKAKLRTAKNIKSSINQVGNVTNKVSSGSSGAVLTSTLSKAGAVTGFIGVLIASLGKLATFGVNVYEVNTGNALTSHNARTMINTVMSGGTNYAYGFLQNEIFTKTIIQRQNYSLDYYRELYDINTEGNKYKKI